MEYLKVWTNFREVIATLGDAEKGRLFDAMLLYADNGAEPVEFRGNERFLWPVAKRDIDLAASKSETNRANASKKKKDEANASEDERNEANESETERNEAKASLNNKEIIKKEKEKKDNILTDEKEKPQKRFTPPTLEEVVAYCKERKNSIDPEYFIAYNENRNWTLSNGKKMKDWKLAIVTWEKHDFNKTTPANATVKKVVAQDYTQRNYDGEDEEAFGRMLEYEASLQNVQMGEA